MAVVEHARRTKRSILFLFGLLLCIYALFPFYWMIISSLKYNPELYQAIPTYFPRTPTFQRYADALVRGGFFIYMLNSVYVAAAATLISLVLAVLAGYGFARYRIRAGKIILFGILMTYTFPRILAAIPFYSIFREFGLIDTRLSLVIVYITFSLPFAIWLMRNYFASLPVSMEECAMIDGCNRLQIIWKIVLPVAKPAIAAAAIYNFVTAWNEYLFASVFVRSINLRTLPVGLAAIIGEFVTDWGMLMAGAVVSTVPVVCLFAVLQRYLVTGLSAGSTKG